MIVVLPLVGVAANLRFDSGPFWFGCVGALLGTLGGWAWRHFDDARASTARRIAASDSERLTVVHEERSALARELHDVVARQLSLVTLRVMAVWECQDTDTLAAACDDIEDATHTARHELRTLVAGMQGGPEESDPGTHVVPPTITMECLANDLLAHGFTVRHRIDPAADALDPMTTRTITRVLQEATTNILRHGAPGTTCSYTFTLDHDTITLTIDSQMSRTRDRGALSLGYGLRGLKERIELTGGTFHAGPHARQWSITARLPYQLAGAPDDHRQLPPGPLAPPRASVAPRAVGGARGQAVLPLP